MRRKKKRTSSTIPNDRNAVLNKPKVWRRNPLFDDEARVAYDGTEVVMKKKQRSNLG